MDNLLLAVVALCSRWLQPRHNVQVQFLEAQIRILRERVKAERIILSPTERAELLRLGSELEHQVGELLHVVKPDTYQRWRQDQKQGKVPKGVGRPPLAKEIQDLITRFATENAQWGYRCIVGELKKLGHEVSASAARGDCESSRLDVSAVLQMKCSTSSVGLGSGSDRRTFAVRILARQPSRL